MSMSIKDCFTAGTSKTPLQGQEGCLNGFNESFIIGVQKINPFVMIRLPLVL